MLVEYFALCKENVPPEDVPWISIPPYLIETSSHLAPGGIRNGHSASIALMYLSRKVNTGLSIDILRFNAMHIQLGIFQFTYSRVSPSTISLKKPLLSTQTDVSQVRGKNKCTRAIIYYLYLLICYVFRAEQFLIVPARQELSE